MSDVTRILEAMNQGDPEAGEELMPLVYEELRRMAANKMSMEGDGHTLQPTALVHEAWLRLGGTQEMRLTSRVHFFGVAAEAMRRILVEHARRKQAQKRGGGSRREELRDSHWISPVLPDELLTVHEALEKLATHDPQTADLVKLRYFVGMTMEETAAALGLSKRTAESLWTYARAWLKREMRRQ